MIFKVLKSWVFWLSLGAIYFGWPEPDYQLDPDDLYVVTGVNFSVGGAALSVAVYPFVFLDQGEPDLKSTIEHEFVHIVQQKREGFFFFIIKYYYYFAENYLYYSSHYQKMDRRVKIWTAYREIPYEKEAYKD